MSKKDNIPETSDPQDSTITYASDVISTIAGIAVSEVEGISGTVSAGSSGFLGKKKDVTKGVRVELGTEEVSVDIYLNVEYGVPIQKAASDVQENVRKAVESMTGLHVVRVDVHVQGVSFEKENKTLEAGKKTAALEDGKKSEKKAPAPKVEFVDDEPAAEEEVGLKVDAVIPETEAETEEIAEEREDAVEEAEEVAADIEEEADAEMTPEEIADEIRARSEAAEEAEDTKD